MRLVMCDRRGPDETCAEAEPVLVAVDRGRAVLHLDDGATLAFDAAELQAALAIDELSQEAA